MDNLEVVERHLCDISASLRELVDLVRRDVDGVERHRAQQAEAHEVVSGDLTQSTKVDCERCGGHGQIGFPNEHGQRSTCPACHGAGVVKEPT